MFGMFDDDLDAVALRSFGVFLSVVVVYVRLPPPAPTDRSETDTFRPQIGAGTSGLAIARYRAQDSKAGFFKIFYSHYSRLPFMFIFFGGISWHCLTALMAVRRVFFLQSGKIKEDGRGSCACDELDTSFANLKLTSFSNS